MSSVDAASAVPAECYARHCLSESNAPHSYAGVRHDKRHITGRRPPDFAVVSAEPKPRLPNMQPGFLPPIQALGVRRRRRPDLFSLREDARARTSDITV